MTFFLLLNIMYIMYIAVYSVRVDTVERNRFIDWYCSLPKSPHKKKCKPTCGKKSPPLSQGCWECWSTPWVIYVTPHKKKKNTIVKRAEMAVISVMLMWGPLFFVVVSWRAGKNPSLGSGPFYSLRLCHLSRYPIVRDSPSDRDTPRIANFGYRDQRYRAITWLVANSGYRTD